jgi:type IV secretion system protein TrbI
MAEIPDPYSPPEVQQRSTKPPGVLPRNAQAWVLGGIALLMVIVIAFSGKTPPKTQNAGLATPAAAVVDPNAGRIQEYRARIQEQAQKLAAEQARLAETRQSLSPTSAPPMTAGGGLPYGSSSGHPTSMPDTLAAKKKNRAYQSLFASNISLSYRPETRTSQPQRSAAWSPEATPNTAFPYGYPAALLAAAQTGWPPSSSASANPMSSDQATPTPTPTTEKRARRGSTELNQAEGKAYRLFEGTVIETVLTNRLDGSFSGPLNCMVTTALHSHDGRKLLIPQGSRVLGEVRKVETFGQQRLAVMFHRLIMPDGYALDLDAFQGLNQIGETGLVDQINHHYLQVFGVSLAIGAIAGLSQANTRYGFDASAIDAYRQGVGSSLSQSSLRILDRYLNVLPTFTIREGHRVKVYLTEDLTLPAYDQHRMPPDL